MTWEQLYAEIDAGRARPVYLFYGVEEFVKRGAVERLRQKLLPEGLEALNESAYEGEVPARQLIEAAQTLPMMCKRRLVVSRDWPPLLPGAARNEKEEAQQIIDWLPKAPETCTLVFFVRQAPDLRKKLPAALVKLGADVKFEYLSDADLFKWAAGRLKGAGKQIDREAVNQLVFMAGRALTALDGELGKLAAYVGERPLIRRADVERVVHPSLECTVFQMIDALMAGKAARAHELYKVMLEAGENRVGILAMLTRQMRILTHIKLLKGQGMGLREIERALELNHYAAQQAERQAAQLTLQAVEAGYKACAEADYQIKSGQVRDAAAVDARMLRLGAMRGGGGA